MEVSKTDIAILILAAGSSTRMGTPKQILPWGDTTLLGNAIRSAQGTGIKDIYVVLGANAPQILEINPIKDIHFLTNSNWKEGLGTSIATGMRYFQEANKNYRGVLVMLGDQPLIDTTYLNKMITTFTLTKNSIVCTAYDEKKGVPALFDQVYFKEMILLSKDYGAKEILHANKKKLLALNALGKAVDLDTMEAYKRLRADTFSKS
ncbi:nucleotidyltransferase family protein [Spongiimicrobium salis]|uniref:nucleotidyltransferase family protein n=1 Tax=Spongiimicrobium salis TaxID=1667022 RepID=UPI00374DA485